MISRITLLAAIVLLVVEVYGSSVGVAQRNSADAGCVVGKPSPGSKCEWGKPRVEVSCNPVGLETCGRTDDPEGTLDNRDVGPGCTFADNAVNQTRIAANTVTDYNARAVAYESVS